MKAESVGMGSRVLNSFCTARHRRVYLFGHTIGLDGSFIDALEDAFSSVHSCTVSARIQ